MDNGEATSELEEVLENESMLEVESCNGRGGNECCLVAVAILSKASVENSPATVSTGTEEKQRKKGLTGHWLGVDTDDVLWVTTLSSEPGATRNQDVSSSATERSVPRFLCYRTRFVGHNFSL